MTGTDTTLLGAGAAARVAGVTPAALYRAARLGRLPVAGLTPRGDRLYTLADVAAFRDRRISRLLRELRAALEPAVGVPWDENGSAALDVVLDLEDRAAGARTR